MKPPFPTQVRGHVNAKPNPSTKALGPCLKLVVARASPHEILGVHIFGPDAAELVHFGTTLVQNDRTAHDALDLCYAAVTYHELYKLAARNALDKIAMDALKQAFSTFCRGKRLPKDTLRTALGELGAAPDDARDILKTIFAGANDVKGDLFVKRAMRLQKRLVASLVAAAEHAPPPKPEPATDGGRPG